MSDRDHANVTLTTTCGNCGHPMHVLGTLLVQQRIPPSDPLPFPTDQAACNAPKVKERAKPNAGTVCVHPEGHTGPHSWERTTDD